MRCDSSSEIESCLPFGLLQPKRNGDADEMLTLDNVWVQEETEDRVVASVLAVAGRRLIRDLVVAIETGKKQMLNSHTISMTKSNSHTNRLTMGEKL